MGDYSASGTNDSITLIMAPGFWSRGYIDLLSLGPKSARVPVLKDTVYMKPLYFVRNIGCNTPKPGGLQCELCGRPPKARRHMIGSSRECRPHPSVMDLNSDLQ